MFLTLFVFVGLALLFPKTPRPTSSEGWPPILQPTTYSSPSGEFALFVNPTERSGAGPGDQELRRGGEVLWKRPLPFTLWNSRVTDTGHSFGYGYSNGWRDHRAEGSFHLTLLDPLGEPLMSESIQRTQSRYLHAPPTPLGGQLINLEQRDLVRIFVDEQEHRGLGAAPWVWRTYQLSTGERLADWTVPYPELPREEDFLRPIDWKPVPGTNLTLVHWWSVNLQQDDGVFLVGAWFSLVDDAGQEVWKLERSTEYTLPHDKEGMDLLESRIRQRGAILSMDADATFDLWFPSEGVRAAFEVRGTPGAWQVHPGRREPYEYESPVVPNVESIAPVQLATTPLGRPNEGPSGQVHNLRHFAFAENGLLDLIRFGPEGDEFVRLTLAGDLVRETKLPDLDSNGGTTTWYAGAANTWYAAVRYWGNQARTELHQVDTITGRATALNDFPCPSIQQMVPLPTGGAVLLGEHRYKRTRVGVLLAIDSRGQELWRIPQGDQDPLERSAFFSATDMTVTSDGQIVVLDADRRSLQVVNESGQFVRSIDLRLVCRPAPKRPSHVFPDPSGGVWVLDNGKLWQVSLEGTLGQAIPFRQVHSGRDHTWAHCQGPDGNVWSTDGSALLSIQPDGRPGPFLGRAPKFEAVGQAASSWIDPAGNVWVLNQSSRLWHQFDQAGCGLRVFTMPSGSRLETIRRPRPALGPNGEVFLPLMESGHMRFNAQGEPLGETDLGSPRVQSHPQGTGRWDSQSYDTLLTFQNEDESKQTIRRRPDGRWWQKIEDFHVAADGQRIAVLERPRQAGDGWSLSLLDSLGTGQFVLELPPRRYRHVAVSQHFAVVSGFQSDVLLVDLRDKSMQALLVPESESFRRWGFSPDGDEFWAVEAKPVRLLRFQLPD